jgi:hypothetical protein
MGMVDVSFLAAWAPGVQSANDYIDIALYEIGS